MGKQVRTIRLGRKIQPKQFESFEVAIEVQDVLDFNNAEERDAAIQEQNNRVLADFKAAYELATADLGIQDKAVAVTHTTEETVKHGTVVAEKNNAKSLAPSVEELSDDFFDRV